MKKITATAEAASTAYTAFNPAFEGMTNEALYDALCAATAPIDAGLEELQHRLKPIIIGASKAYLNAFSWTFDDAMGEALIHIWQLVERHSYHGGKVGFHNFFRTTWLNKLNSLFAKTVVKAPILMGNTFMGYNGKNPVYACSYAFHEKAQQYRDKQAAINKAYRERKLAEEGKTPQPKKPPMTAEEKRERNRIKAAERFAALTPEERRARYDRDNERRRAARAAETPEEKAERKARYAMYAKARKARKEAENEQA